MVAICSSETYKLHGVTSRNYVLFEQRGIYF
jgi:hypothetical protein